MRPHRIGDAVTFGGQGLDVPGPFHFLQSLWRDLTLLIFGKENL